MTAQRPMPGDNMPRPVAPEHSEPDIVKRLRDDADRCCAYAEEELFGAAADEIESLRKVELEALSLLRLLKAAEHERDKLRERIEKAPLHTVATMPGSAFGAIATDPTWVGKRVRLVVEEG